MLTIDRFWIKNVKTSKNKCRLLHETSKLCKYCDYKCVFKDLKETCLCDTCILAFVYIGFLSFSLSFY